MSDYLPTTTEATGRYSVATFELFQSSTDALDDLAAHAKSENTVSVYRSDWRRFSTWAGSKGINIPNVTHDGVALDGEPIPPALVMLYLADVQDELKPATVTHHLAAIRHFHHEAALISPTDDPRVRRVLAGYTRKHASEPHRAEPLFLADLRAGLPVGDDLRALRDRALLLVGWWGAFRRSELVAITTAHLSDHPEGVIVRIPKSKTDQAAAGQKVALHYRDDTGCRTSPRPESYLCERFHALDLTQKPLGRLASSLRRA